MKTTWNLGAGGTSGKRTATFAILGTIIGVFLLTFIMSGSASAESIASAIRFSVDMSKPWTVLTYPFALTYSGAIWMALWAFVFYQFSSDIEGRLGSWGHVTYFFSLTLLGGLCYYVGTRMFGAPSASLPSIGLVTEYIVFTWCVLNAGATVMLMMVVPVPTRVLMWLCVAAVLIEYGWGNPFLGIFAALPMLAAWLYATDRIAILKFGRSLALSKAPAAAKSNKEFGEFMDRVKSREKEREEKERLRKLFEESMGDDKTG